MDNNINLINGLIEENKHLAKELGKKDAQIFALQSTINALIKVYNIPGLDNLISPRKTTSDQDVVHITNNMFTPQYGGMNG